MTSQSLEGRLDCRPNTLERLAAFGTALLSLGAAGIHFAVLGSHFEEWWGYGVFFAVVASLQALWALPMVHSPGRWLYWAGAVGNAAVIAAWAVTRTAGIPIGPSEGEVENAQFIDLLSVGFQALIVAVCVAMASQKQIATRRLPAAALWTATFVVAVGVMALTSASLVDWASAAEGHAHGEAAAESDTHGEAADEANTHGDAADADAHSDGGEAATMPAD